MTIYLIRHTEVAVGKSVCYGGTDVKLADNYAEQAAKLLLNLPATAPDVVFSSPLTRCRHLAEDLTTPTRKEYIRFDDRLREYHFGDWEMLPWSDIPRDALDAWMVDFVNQAPHNGDSFRAVFDRVSEFWREKVLPLANAESPKTVYIVSHGGVIRALLCLFLELPLQNAYRLHLDYGAVSKLAVQNGTYTVAYINR
ncbi:alpha-ribazole phosphatase [Fibrella forsythiae]|uniref:Alpha-ribazole phosphatase n=1 Tax=Fibrella forsythiae TaxID=2817061 RepID=A0ABS3JBP6_9BACT|nr:alpha-ribazole phosphatase [Fibrella forsythiae]MBO0947406.1 alpha-ribazole phosphatase [Fibrella forsythiae]